MAPVLRVLVVLLLTIYSAWANPDGPPISAYPTLCVDMNPSPGHEASPALNAAPYTITCTTGSTTYTANQVMSVTVEATDAAEFEGVFMQARRRGAGSDGDEAMGVFSQPPVKTQLLTCGKPNSAWAHSDELDATTVSVTWTAPPCDEGPIAFKATIVKGPKELYWINVLSSEMTFTGPNSSDCGQAPPPSGSPPTPTPTAAAAGLGVATLTLMVGVISSLCLVAFISRWK